jgi:hypothetical protein
MSGPTGWLRPTTLAAQPIRPARLELVAEGDHWLVRLRDAAEVYGVQLRLHYDPAELSVLDAGDKAAGRLEAKLSRLETTPHYVFENAVLPASGEVRIAYTLLNPALPLSGDVVLAEIPAAPSGNLSFVEVLLADREGQALPVTWEPNIKKKGR